MKNKVGLGERKIMQKQKRAKTRQTNLKHLFY